MLAPQRRSVHHCCQACNVTDYALVVGISKQDRPVLEAGELSSSAPRVAVSTAADGAIIGDEVYVFGLVDVLHRSPKVYSK